MMARQGQDARRVAIDDEIATLVEMEKAALVERFVDLYGSPPPKRLGRDLVMRAVAHRLQEKAHGGLALTHRRQIKAMIAEHRRTGAIQTVKPPRSIKPGTRLIRDWGGETHEVVVLEKTYAYRGEIHRSLSEIARVITGTRWSGPAFFGLKTATGARPKSGRSGALGAVSGGGA